MTKGAGRYRTLAVIETVKSTAAPGPSGHVDLTDKNNWKHYCERRVEERQITGKEALVGSQPMADVSGLYRLRADHVTEGITPKMRLRIGKRVLNIVRAIRVGNPVREIELACTEVVCG